MNCFYWSKKERTKNMDIINLFPDRSLQYIVSLANVFKRSIYCEEEIHNTFAWLCSWNDRNHRGMF